MELLIVLQLMLVVLVLVLISSQLSRIVKAMEEPVKIRMELPPVVDSIEDPQVGA